MDYEDAVLYYTEEYGAGSGNRYNGSKFEYWWRLQEKKEKLEEKRKRKEEKHWIKFGL